jgi:hypothetical protein
MNATSKTPFLSQNREAITFLPRNIRLNLLRSGEPLCTAPTTVFSLAVRNPCLATSHIMIQDFLPSLLYR